MSIWKDESEGDKMRALSLVKTLAYHCKRCNYVWLPRDYDSERDDITEMIIPRCCARCKSKRWYDKRSRREPVSMLPMQPLVDYVKRVLTEGRKDGHHSDREIANMIVAYGRDRKFTDPQISEALRYNGINRYGNKANNVLVRQ